MTKKLLTLFALVVMATIAISGSTVQAEVRLPKTFTDNAVLQRDAPVNIWGWADPGEEITVSFNGQTVSTTACEKGKWNVVLSEMFACCEGQDLVISGSNTITLKNILIGEVWVCSGQSNMEMPLNSWQQPRLACSEEEINGDYSFIRFNRPHHVIAPFPLEDVATDGWKVCKDGVQKDCTATGFHFAVRLHKELGVPVGLIDSNWGGSNINSWIPNEGWFQLPELAEMAQAVKADREAYQEGKDWNPCGGMFNAMMAAWTKYTIRGAIWYQGCSNAGEREFYYYKQKAMIREWRKLWNRGDFPFYWVQLANFTAPSDDPAASGDWPGLRDGQTKCLEVINTGQAVTIDIGEEKDIHPRNKFDVGNRLALWALAKLFNKDVECCSPTFKTISIDDNKAILTFDYVGSGLVVGQNIEREPLLVEKEGKLTRFAIAGADQKWVWADAEIIGKNQIAVSSPEVPNPVAVRYAWQMNPTGCNLYSAEGLPATPFRTDAW
ncbi:MAG: sialate O-acetylesterase [Planctomycetia bacterium]|nr:sialate O-acetylesterase [Planctomycetia bacterium]